MRRFAKRQLTWFRARKNLKWIELKPDESLENPANVFSGFMQRDLRPDA
jgi:tRNA A37 N6-isopentenylltransferase MiaA